jgi:hypothetical protein
MSMDEKCPNSSDEGLALGARTKRQFIWGLVAVGEM